MKALNAVISFFKNKWTKIGFSALSLGYGFFMLWLAWLTYSFHLVPTSAVSLFMLYLVINFTFGFTMFYTRKEIATQITACLLHPCILVMWVFAFGNWYLLIPALAVATIMFILAGTPESVKTILFTIYLILFVLATLAYMTLQIFGITNAVFMNMDLRSDIYIFSTNDSYRLVMYIDEENKENRTVAFHAEFTEDDIRLPYLIGERYTGSTEVMRRRLPRDFEIEVIENADGSNANMLIIKEFGTDPETGERMVIDTLEVEWLTPDMVRIHNSVFTAPDFISPAQQTNDDEPSWGDTTPFFPAEDTPMTRANTQPPGSDSAPELVE
jgi:hypothetical protein